MHDFGHNRFQMSSNVILIRLAACIVFGHRNGLYSAAEPRTFASREIETIRVMIFIADRKWKQFRDRIYFA